MRPVFYHMPMCGEIESVFIRRSGKTKVFHSISELHTIHTKNRLHICPKNLLNALAIHDSFMIYELIH